MKYVSSLEITISDKIGNWSIRYAWTDREVRSYECLNRFGGQELTTGDGEKGWGLKNEAAKNATWQKWQLEKSVGLALKSWQIRPGLSSRAKTKCRLARDISASDRSWQIEKWQIDKKVSCIGCNLLFHFILTVDCSALEHADRQTELSNKTLFVPL